MGDLAKAVPLYQRALNIWEKVLGPDHPDTATCLDNLAGLYGDMGNYAKAEPLKQRALKIRQKVLGPNHPDTAASLNNLAELYLSMGDYVKAETLCQRALKIREKALGLDHPDTATSLHSLAELYEYIGDYEKAEPLYQRTLKIREKVLGSDHPDTAESLNNLAVLYLRIGAYAKAAPLYQRALKIQENALGPDHPHTATSLHSLAGFYENIGDYEKAELLYQRALKIWKKALGTNHPYTALSLHDLALHYHKMGEYAKAKSLLQRALKINKKTLGPNHPYTATCIANIAELYRSMGDYTKAEQFLQRALKIGEKALGLDHPHTAMSLNNLAVLYIAMGDYVKAEPLYQRALKIFEKTLGPDQQDTTTCLNNLAQLYFDLGRKQEALEITKKVQQAGLKTLNNILSFASEQQRLSYQSTLYPYYPYSLLPSLDKAPEIALTILRYKGIVLNSVVEDRRVAAASKNTGHQGLIDQLHSTKQRLSQLLWEAPKDFTEQTRLKRESEKERLSKEVEQIESALARHVAGIGKTRQGLSVTVAQVQHAIPRHTVLIEIVRYGHYMGANKFKTRYGASIITSSGEPKWVILGEASAIEKTIAQYQGSVHNEVTKVHETEFTALLKTLYQQLWLPIETAIPKDTKNIIISPDGALNFVSSATLVTPEDQFLAQRYSISYVSSGRDLLQDIKPSSTQQMTIYANPDFSERGLIASKGTSTTGLVASGTLDMSDLQSLHFDPLPGTAKEGVFLEARARKWNWPVQCLSKADATEAQLRAVRSPRILHLATHGFFLPEADIEGLRGKNDQRGIGGVKSFSDISLNGKSGSVLNKQVILKNPMHRSGLALAGAQATFDAWKKGEVPPTNNDGVVNAEEIGSLKLDGTWLVTLSACDTGTGEAKSGEGVMGLRRGFIQAGAQHLLMTLWSVADEATVKFMVDFYETVHKSGNAPQALADVQRKWLIKLRKERGLPAAVILAGPFIMSSQGPR